MDSPLQASGAGSTHVLEPEERIGVRIIADSWLPERRWPAPDGEG